MTAAVFKAIPLASNRLADVREPWRRLLRASDSDPLFLDWSWQQLWWETYSTRLPDAQLLGFTLQDDGGEIVAIANVYLQCARRLPLLKFRSLQFVGASWRTPVTMMTEYLEPIVSKRGNASLVDRILAGISEIEWDEFVVELTPREGVFADAVRQWCIRSRCYLREMDHCVAYQARLNGGFDSYVGKLSANARRRLLNNRSRLRARGRVELRFYEGRDVVQAMHTLNELHARRWQQSAFDQRRMEFYQTLHEMLPGDAKPIVSVIEVNGSPVAAVYDLRVGSRQYNLQMGFDPQFDATISLGVLQLGYAIEDAASAGVLTYDFLAGNGMRSNYKQRISTASRQLVTLQVVRNPLGKMLYRCRDLLRNTAMTAAR